MNFFINLDVDLNDYFTIITTQNKNVCFIKQLTVVVLAILYCEECDVRLSRVFGGEEASVAHAVSFGATRVCLSVTANLTEVVALAYLRSVWQIIQYM